MCHSVDGLLVRVTHTDVNCREKIIEMKRKVY